MLNSNVIVDNSTLSAIQRITGHIQVPQNYSVEGDYSALENFCSSLLFYDNIYFVDDYKEEHKEGRANFFKYIRPINAASFPYEELETLAAKYLEHLTLGINAGELDNTALTEFLEIMGLHLTAAWHMQSSDYFLTLKVLSNNPDYDEERYKYSKLTQMIFNQTSQLSHGENNKDGLQLIGRDGLVIVEEPYQKSKQNHIIGEQVKELSNSLNWLSRRSVFYSLLSSHFGSGLCLHPIRHNFLASYSTASDFFDNSNYWINNFREFFRASGQNLINEINANSESQELGLELPLLAAWSVGKTGTVEKGIEHILELRTQPPFINIRKYFNELINLEDSSKRKKKVNQLRIAIGQETTDLKQKYNIPTNSNGVQISANIGSSFGLKVSKSVDLSGLLSFGKANKIRTMYRNVVDDIARFPNLGRVRGQLLSTIKRDGERRYPTLRIEEYRYRNYESTWKKPM